MAKRIALGFLVDEGTSPFGSFALMAAYSIRK
jgi:hypothetical protein